MQNYYGYPKLADYLSQTGTVATISPKVYAAYAFGGDAGDIVITFGSATCNVPATGAEPGRVYGSLRGPTGVGVPSYISGATCGGRYFVERNKVYDTGQAARQPVPGARTTATSSATTPAHEGGDIWATDAALDVMDQRGLERHLRDAARASTRRPTCGAASTTRSRPSPATTR